MLLIVSLLGAWLLQIAGAIPGKLEEFHVLDAPESEWNWLARLTDRYQFNAEAQNVLHHRLVINYMRPIPKPPRLITNANPITVLLWETMGFEGLLEDHGWVGNCSVPCKVSTKHADSERAHMLLTTAREAPEIFHFLQPWQQTALFVLEPNLIVPNVAARVAPYNMLVSFSRNSDVRVDYSRSLRVPEGRPDLRKKNKEALAAVFISNCDSNGDARYRLDYVKELSIHMPIHSYGKCLHTAGLATAINNTTSMMSDYYFVLVFENTLLDDYVTDHFYQALASDAVPVYLGAPNIAEYLPDPNSSRIIIEARNYPDPASLARQLQTLAENEAEYLEYFEWRDKGISHAFSKQHDFEAKGEDSFICRMCTRYNDLAEK